MKINFLKDKTILVTGGTGSVGKNLIRYILAHAKPKKVIVFSRDELKQSQMQEELKDDRLRFFLGDVRDLPRLERAFKNVDIVVHAAALKQVPTVEYNPFEAVKTNILGSQNVIDAAIDQGVSKVLLISSDKAAQPINLYGSTKLCAEKLFISGNVYADKKTRLSCVRYGNVIGSRGSIVELLIKNKLGTVSITDERMTRFWLQLEDSLKLVLFGLEHMEGGEIFIPKKVPSMSLVNLVNTIAPKAKKRITGIRPGEKIHEILLTEEEARHSVELEDYYVILPRNENIGPARFKKYHAKGKKLPEDFFFASHNNTLQFTQKEMAKIVADVEKNLVI